MMDCVNAMTANKKKEQQRSKTLRVVLGSIQRVGKAKSLQHYGNRRLLTHPASFSIVWFLGVWDVLGCYPYLNWA